MGNHNVAITSQPRTNRFNYAAGSGLVDLMVMRDTEGKYAKL